MIINVIRKLLIADEATGVTASVDSSGFLKVVSPPSSLPVGAHAVLISVRSSVPANGYVRETYIIPAGKYVRVKYIEGGGANSSKSSRITLYHCLNGVVDANSKIIACGYVREVNYSQHHDEDYGPGDGTQAIVLERQRLDSVAVEIYAMARGYEWS